MKCTQSQRDMDNSHSLSPACVVCGRVILSVVSICSWEFHMLVGGSHDISGIGHILPPPVRSNLFSWDPHPFMTWGPLIFIYWKAGGWPSTGRPLCLRNADSFTCKPGCSWRKVKIQLRQWNASLCDSNFEVAD